MVRVFADHLGHKKPNGDAKHLPLGREKERSRAPQGSSKDALGRSACKALRAGQASEGLRRSGPLGDAGGLPDAPPPKLPVYLSACRARAERPRGRGSASRASAAARAPRAPGLPLRRAARPPS